MHKKPVVDEFNVNTSMKRRKNIAKAGGWGAPIYMAPAVDASWNLWNPETAANIIYNQKGFKYGNKPASKTRKTRTRKFVKFIRKVGYSKHGKYTY